MKMNPHVVPPSGGMNRLARAATANFHKLASRSGRGLFRLKAGLLALSLVLAAASAFAHGEVEVGPNGGRILEFSKDETMHGEVIVKDGKFQIAVLDKVMKPVALGQQVLTATSADRANPAKLNVEIKDGKFVVPTVKEGEWIVFQYRESAKAKPITARLQYDTKPCGECKKPEWLCICAAEKGAKKK